jgi:hypothetical protein
VILPRASSSVIQGVPSAHGAAPTLTRTADGTSITLTSATATRATAYSYRQSTDGVNWGGTVNISSGTAVTITGLVYDQTYYYQTLGRNSTGSGAFSATSNIIGELPSFIGVGTDVEVTSPTNLGDDYTDGVQALRTRIYSIFSGELPTGMTLNSSTGEITGRPSSTTVFTFSFVISATNNVGSVQSPELTIEVVVPSGGSLDNTFDINIGSGTAGIIQSMAVQADGKIILGGSFTNFNGVTVNRIARLSSDGILDTNFNTNKGLGLTSQVNSVAIQSNGRIVIGGAFITFNGESKARIASIGGDIASL